MNQSTRNASIACGVAALLLLTPACGSDDSSSGSGGGSGSGGAGGGSSGGAAGSAGAGGTSSGGGGGATGGGGGSGGGAGGLGGGQGLKETIVFQRGGQSSEVPPGPGGEVLVMNFDGKSETNLTNTQQKNEGRPVFSLDAKWVAYDEQSSPYPYPYASKICTMAAVGGSVTCLGDGKSWDGMPAFSPDGKLIAFVSTRDGSPYPTWQDAKAEIYVMNADGTAVTRLTNDTALDIHPAFSPDGKSIVFASNRDAPPYPQKKDIYTMNANGTGITRLTHGEGDNGEPTFSPDGKSIVFVSDRDGHDEIYLMSATGTAVTRLTTTSSSPYGNAVNGAPVFTHDGKYVLFHSNRDTKQATLYQIYVMNADGTGVTRLTNNNDSDTHPTPAFGIPVGEPGGPGSQIK